MSSTNKTTRLGLNQWVASDKPKRTDFNNDNEIIEQTITAHLDDLNMHVTSEERESWNTTTHFGMYFGNGQNSRVIETSCTFEPKLALVFANSRPISYVDFGESRKYNYLALATPTSSTVNLQLNTDGTLTVGQDISASYQNEYTCLNQTGVSYTYVLIK